MMDIQVERRRTIVILLLTLCMGFAGAGVAAAAEPADRGVFRAGAYAIDITPPEFPISVNGGMRDRTATGNHDPLHARCIVLDDGETKLAIVVVDSCMVPREVLDEAKRLAREATGIATDHMLMSATHTHTAPTVAGVFQSEPDAGYQRFLAARIAEGVERAFERLEPAQVGWAVGSDPTQVFNRRWLLKDGTVYTDPLGRERDRVKMNPGYNNPDVDRPAGPVDPEVPVLALRSPGGRPIAVLANYALHYVGGVHPLSADYYGVFAKRFAELIGAEDTDPPFMAVMSNGASGDINNIDYSRDSGPKREPFEQVRIVADSVARAAFEAYETIEYHDHVPLAVREAEVELGVRRPSEAEVAEAKAILDAADGPVLRSTREVYARETVLLSDYPPTVRLKLQAMRIGGVGIAAIPCETFVEIGLAIKERSPLDTTFTIGLANGYNGYLPTVEQHELGGYETWRARSSYLEKQAAPKIKDTVTRLLDEVAR